MAQSVPPKSPPHQPRRRGNALEDTARFAGILSVVVLVGAAIAIWWKAQGRRLYADWQVRQDVRTAQRAYDGGKFEEAALHARQAAAVDALNPAAARLAAQAYEQLDRPESVRWWRTTAELEGNSPDTVAHWAYAAFRHGDLHSAYVALRSFPADADTAAYHDIAGRVAQERGDLKNAALQFQAALAKAPGDPEIQLRFALMHILSTNEPLRVQSRGLLEKLVNDPKRRPAALTGLIRDSLARGEAAESQRLSDALLATPGTSFADRLVHLSALRAGDSPVFAPELARLQTDAAAEPAKVAQLLLWLGEEKLWDEGFRWHDALPYEIQTASVVMPAVAELYVGRQDWAGLRQWIFNANWADYESHRYAYEALVAVRENPETGIRAAESSWQRAIQAAQDNPIRLSWLAAKGELWVLGRQAETTLWLLVEMDWDAEGALERLDQVYRLLNDAHGLYRVAQHRLLLHPQEPAVMADLVYFGALLRLDMDRLHPQVSRLEKEDVATDPHSVVSRALYQLRVGTPEAAMLLLEKLPRQELELPHRMAVYTFALAKAGDRANARHFLRQVTTETLLPEEFKLVEEARLITGVN